MGLKNTKLYVLDNTGALIVKCLHVFKKSVFEPGSLLTCVIKKVAVGKKVKKGQICKVIVVRQAQVLYRPYGLVLFDVINGVIILKKNEFVPAGTRFFGPICVELRKLYLTKLITLAPYLL